MNGRRVVRSGRARIGIVVTGLIVSAVLATMMLPSLALATTYTAEYNMQYQTSDVVISSGGSYRVTGVSGSHGIVVNTNDPVTITLDYAHINLLKGMAKSPLECGGNLTLLLRGDNELLSADNSYTGIHLPQGDSLTIDSSPDNLPGVIGKLTVVGGELQSGIGTTLQDDGFGSLVIKGGQVIATGGYNGAGIGGGDRGDGGDITISGGIVTATGGTKAAGIGGGYCGNGGTTTITGGTVTANGSTDGAGIGGGVHDSNLGGAGGYGGTITITGGTVTANGSTNGAGIGGGKGGNGGPVTISGGAIHAHGGDYAAGIGGGKEDGVGAGGEGGTFTLSGGTVTATGGTQGAGIGGGNGGQADTTLVSGGTLVTTGGEKGAGIGGGYTGNTTKDDHVITITGGTVTATGGDGGAGIGGGCENWAGTGGNPGPVVIRGGSVKAAGGGSGTEGIGHGRGDGTKGSVSDGHGDTCVRTQTTGMVDAAAPLPLTLSQHVVTSKATYDYTYTGSGHGGGDTSIYVYLPSGITFQPVLALLAPLMTELETGVKPPAAASYTAAGSVNTTPTPELRAWVIAKLKSAKVDYNSKRFTTARHTLIEVRDEIAAQSGVGVSADRAARWVRVLDLIVRHHPEKLGAVPFAAASSRLSSAAKSTLRACAGKIAARRSVRVSIDGYTSRKSGDSASTRAANARLAKARALSVRSYLTAQLRARGAHTIVTAVGHGTADPLRSNRTAAGRAANRRAEVWVR